MWTVPSGNSPDSPHFGGFTPPPDPPAASLPPGPPGPPPSAVWGAPQSTPEPSPSYSPTDDDEDQHTQIISPEMREAVDRARREAEGRNNHS